MLKKGGLRLAFLTIAIYTEPKERLKGRDCVKFNHGYWMLQEDVEQLAAREVAGSRLENGGLTVFVACRAGVGRGSSINGPLLTIEFTSPAENVIRVRAYHHKGGLLHRPAFPLAEASPAVTVRETEESFTVRTGKVSAVIQKKGYAVRFYYEDRLLTSGGENGGLARMLKGGEAYMREELALDVGEQVYGLGERFTPFVKNGQSVDIWNEDGGTCSEQGYKNVPFYLSSRGYGVLVNDAGRVSYEVGSEKVNRVQFSVPGELMDYFIFGGADLKDALRAYTAVAGRPALPPAWSFGLWLSTSFVTNYDEATVMEFIDGMLERGIPLEVFHFDCCWMPEYEWCSFLWDEKTFPDPKGLLQKIHRKGIKTCVWINPYIAQKSPLFDVCMERGYLLRRPDGSVWQWDMWQAGMGVLDFTNPDAVAWYQGKLEALLDMGVDCFKTDFGERIPTDVVYFDNAQPERMHNYYTLLYNRAVFDVLEKRRGKGEAVLFARSATVGGQQFPVHWGGDCTSRYTSMAESLRGGLSLSMCGFGFWNHDIGGFEDGCNADLYKRWTQFGLLSSHSRYHGSGQYKVPWMYGEEAVEVTRRFTRLKLRLMPYLYRCAVESAREGIPVMRPMALEFPEDETCLSLDRQYMLGAALLVAPVFREDGAVSYYLPEGAWTGLLTGEVKQGGRWYRETCDYFHLPLYVRENTVLVTADGHDSAQYDYLKDVTVNLYGFTQDGTARQEVYAPGCAASATVTVKRENGALSVDTGALGGKVTVLLNNQPLKVKEIQE